jgi:hypothetical protein
LPPLAGLGTGLKYAPTASFHAQNIIEPLLTRLRSAIDEINTPGHRYRTVTVTDKVGGRKARTYSETRMFSSINFDVTSPNWTQYQEKTKGPTAICPAPPTIAAFMKALSCVNAELLHELFGDAPPPFDTVYKEGRLFADMALISYTKTSIPQYHLDPPRTVLMFSFTLGEQQRWFVGEHINRNGSKAKLKIPLGAGSAYFASPCLFRHGTWNAEPNPAAQEGGWRGTTLAVHCRPLLTTLEHHGFNPSSSAHKKLLLDIQNAIIKGRFRTPTLQEATVRQLATLTQETQTDHRHAKTPAADGHKNLSAARTDMKRKRTPHGHPTTKTTSSATNRGQQLPA